MAGFDRPLRQTADMGETSFCGIDRTFAALHQIRQPSDVLRAYHRRAWHACDGEQRPTAHLVCALNLSEPDRGRKEASSKSAIPTSIETSATLKIQMNPSFDASNKSTTAPKRIRSRAYPMAPATIKANPTVLRRAVAYRRTTPTRINATARFSAVSPQRVSSLDTGTRPNALL